MFIVETQTIVDITIVYIISYIIIYNINLII